MIAAVIVLASAAAATFAAAVIAGTPPRRCDLAYRLAAAHLDDYSWRTSMLREIQLARLLDEARADMARMRRRANTDTSLAASPPQRCVLMHMGQPLAARVPGATLAGVAA